MTRKRIALLVALIMIIAVFPAGAGAADRAAEAARSHALPDARIPELCWDFETEPTDWTFIDSDGDGFNWEWQGDYSLTPHMTAFSGEGLIFSASYDNEGGEALFPDNWAITPAVAVPEDAVVFTFMVCGQDADWCEEHYAVYAGTSPNTADMTQIAGEAIATGDYTQRNIDIADYAGQTVYFAIRHFNISDMFFLNIDLVEIYTEQDFVEPTPAPTVAPPAEGNAKIVLTVHDVWGDGSGYQMLIDADANTFGSVIPERGPLTDSGDASAETYDEFEYKIPAGADGAMSTSNVLIDGTLELELPAGIYDWCITNPTPGDRIWIASEQGNVGGRQDDYEFIDGCVYEFLIALQGSNDSVNVTITGENAPEIPVPVVGFYFESDEEMSGFTLVDADGDGLNWKRKTTDGNYSAYEGTGFAYSASYWSGDYKTEADADNWLITPALTVPASEPMLTYYAKNYSSTFMDDLAVYIGTTNDITQMSVLKSAYEPSSVYSRTEIDLADYAGQTVYVAFRHTGYDEWALMLDQIELWGSDETPEPVYHEVTFVDGLTDDVIEVVQVEDGSAAAAPEAPVHEAYEFVGWDPADFSNVTSDMTVTAVYERIRLIGDADCSGTVELADVSALTAYLLNSAVLTEEGLLNADANLDGLVDILDAAAICDIVMNN